ncbi:hypothetical protein [Streptomyces sp. NPDC051219]|uniref:hypothetical protein n=1 Tax=Streptomyces sp. NPDC051219 TaxID=3155283 RepID=UPI003412AB10
MRRLAGLTAAVTVLTVTASGCVTVHGELEVVPSATKAEATQALKDFTDAYNKADRAFDPALDAGRVTGALGAINQAGLKAKGINNPNGNPQHVPLELADASFTIPRKAGWPRWFVADTDSNRDTDQGPQDNRWMLVFVRGGADQLWEVAYLSILTPDEIPAFRTDKDGFAEPVAPADASLAMTPQELSKQYAAYLQSGKPADFVAGQHTTQWRDERSENARRPGVSTQYVDQALDTGTFAPLGLRTKDGGALVFFATRHYEQQTAARGVRLQISPDVKALMSGTITDTVIKERVSSQAVSVPAIGSAAPRVAFLNRIQGLVGAKGS